MADIVSYHFFHADRPRPKLRPLRALGHFRKLMADKEDTAQYFHMSECLMTQRTVTLVERFCESERGRTLMAKEPDLPHLLDDHRTLEAMPSDSVAHAYLSFMRNENLSAAGLVAESEKSGIPSYADQMQWLHDRLRDTHDLVHVLTGYGRDALGEACVLGFSAGQFPWGEADHIFPWGAALEIGRQSKITASAWASVSEAKRHGKTALPIYAEDVMAMMAEPLEAARKRLGIGGPTKYLLAHQQLRERGIDPFKVLKMA